MKLFSSLVVLLLLQAHSDTESTCQNEDIRSRTLSCAVAADSLQGGSSEAAGLLQHDVSARSVRIVDSKGVREEAKDDETKDISSTAATREEKKPSQAKPSGASKVGINLSVKWMKNPLPVAQAVAAIERIQAWLGLSRPIERVKTYDLSPSNRAMVEEIVQQSNKTSGLIGKVHIKELVIGIGNKELKSIDWPWLRSIYERFSGSLHVAVGNEPDRAGIKIPADKVEDAIRQIKDQMPGTQVTVPFAYSIMETSHPVSAANLTKKFKDEFHNVLPLLDYFTINIYPFLSAGVRGVATENLTGSNMSFLNDQISALRIALDRDFPHNNLPLAIGETGWPTCGAARANPYAFATLEYAQEFLTNVAKWMESSESDGRIVSGQLFTAFDEETKGTRAIERYYGILTSTGQVKNAYSCVTNATEASQAWLEKDYPDCESDLDWMVSNFDNPDLQEKFAGRDIDGSLCSFQQYLYDRWASCPPVTRIPGDTVDAEGDTIYGVKSAATKCWSQRLADKYSDRGAIVKPNVSHLTGQTEAKSQKSSHDGIAFKIQDGKAPASETGPAKIEFQTLQIYWINLDASQDRRKGMEAMFDDLRKAVPQNVNLQISRVPAIGPNEVKAMEKNKSLTVDATLIDACTVACTEHHARGELLYTEMGCSLSHLRAVDMAFSSGAESALIIEDDIRIFPELGDDLHDLLAVAPKGWSALQMSTVSTKALLTLLSSSSTFLRQDDYFLGTGAYFIHRSGMQVLRNTYAGQHFKRQQATSSAASLQAESVLFGALPQGSVHTSARYYVNFMKYPTTVHKMSETSEYYAVSSVDWQTNFLNRHRSRAPFPELQKQTNPVSTRLLQSSFLAMTTLVCRNSSSFENECRSIASSIRELRQYNFTWAVYVVISDPAQDGNCPGMESFKEFRELGVSLNYRLNAGRFSKWVYYTEDVEQFAKHDFLIVYDADMGLSSFPWVEYFKRYDEYANKFGIAPITGSVRNRSPFFPLKADWWSKCNRTAIRYVETDLVEQWFAMLNGAFATWYLRKVVETGLVMQQRTLGVDWGVDSAWCGAAAEWASRESGCLMMPIDMYHGDTRSLKQDVTFHQNGEHLTNMWWEKVPQWMKTSQLWLGSFFQDQSLGCSPIGLEERYHMPVDLRTVVPVVATRVPDNRSHHNVEGLTDQASGSSYIKNKSKDKDAEDPDEPRSSASFASLTHLAAAAVIQLFVA